jgi:integrase/recombinase XerD
MKAENTKHGSVYPFLDARTPMKNSDQLPVKLSVNIDGNVFRVGLKLYATPEVFQKALSSVGSATKEVKALKTAIDTHLQRARDVLQQYPNTNQRMFISLFKSESGLKSSGKTDVAALFQQKIDELTAEDRAGSITFYVQGLSAFHRYRKPFYLEDITVEWLRGFRTWYLNQGNSNATAQIHFRSLRHIYNRAIKAGLISQGLYPFKDYTIGTTSKSKDVLYPEQLKELFNYKSEIYQEERAKDFFKFLYLGSGMNIFDALSIKGGQIKGDMLTFVRTKTSKTNSQTKDIIVYLHPEAKRIIEKWGTLNTTDYIFPPFRGTTSNMERKHAKDVFARNLNVHLRNVGKAIGLNLNLTTSIARHSFATKLYIDGTPTSYISEALGHSSGAVTNFYLKTLPDNKFREMSESLLRF